MSNRNFTEILEESKQVVANCIKCNHEVKLPYTNNEDLVLWLRRQMHTQDVFPTATPADREITLSGLCGDCWNKTFGIKPASSVRPLNVIANEIQQNWKNIYFGALPYLNAMLSLKSINDSYGQDDAKSIVLYFLGNANTWRGDVARRVKAELNKMIK